MLTNHSFCWPVFCPLTVERDKGWTAFHLFFRFENRAYFLVSQLLLYFLCPMSVAFGVSCWFIACGFDVAVFVASHLKFHKIFSLRKYHSFSWSGTTSTWRQISFYSMSSTNSSLSEMKLKYCLKCKWTKWKQSSFCYAFYPIRALGKQHDFMS